MGWIDVCFGCLAVESGACVIRHKTTLKVARSMSESWKSELGVS